MSLLGPRRPYIEIPTRPAGLPRWFDGTVQSNLKGNTKILHKKGPETLGPNAGPADICSQGGTIGLNRILPI